MTATVLVPVTVTVSATAGSGQATASPKDSSESAAPSVGAAGTRTDPIPAGTAAPVGDWTITLEPTVTNAADAVAAANQFNKPAPDGKQFVMVKVNATYNGAGSKLAAADLQISFVGSGGNTFGSNPDDYCGVIPEPLINTGEVFTAATASGNECALVTTDRSPADPGLSRRASGRRPPSSPRHKPERVAAGIGMPSSALHESSRVTARKVAGPSPTHSSTMGSS